MLKGTSPRGAARKRGVEVRVLIDACNSHVDMVKALLAAGIPAAKSLPTHGKGILRFANLRNHRKIVVIDGTTGFPAAGIDQDLRNSRCGKLF